MGLPGVRVQGVEARPVALTDGFLTFLDVSGLYPAGLSGYTRTDATGEVLEELEELEG